MIGTADSLEMASTKTQAVTGAFGYSGKYIAQRLLDEGQSVITLTNSPSRANSFGQRIRALPFHFDEPDLLTETLRGVSVLYNTYWVRFNHCLFNHADAVRNTLVLFRAAKTAGVERIDLHDGGQQPPTFLISAARCRSV